MKIITLGIDLAKNVFAVHGVDEQGKAVLVRPNVRRDQLLELVGTLVPCVSAWKRAVARTTGQDSSRPTATHLN